MVLSLDGFAMSLDGRTAGCSSSSATTAASGAFALWTRPEPTRWAALKARDDDGTILVHGGPNLPKSMTRLRLIDEYQLTWVPVAIDTGHSPFADLDVHLTTTLDAALTPKQQRQMHDHVTRLLTATATGEPS